MHWLKTSCWKMKAHLRYATQFGTVWGLKASLRGICISYALWREKKSRPGESKRLDFTVNPEIEDIAYHHQFISSLNLKSWELNIKYLNSLETFKITLTFTMLAKNFNWLAYSFLHIVFLGSFRFCYPPPSPFFPFNVLL